MTLSGVFDKDFDHALLGMTCWHRGEPSLPAPLRSAQRAVPTAW